MEKTEKKSRCRQTTRRILLAVFCICIGISVIFVMLNIYDPNQNNMGALCSVCMDIICMLILFILIASFVFDYYGPRRTNRLFTILLISTIWAMFLDFLNWAFDGLLQFGHLTYWFTVGSLCMGSVMACIFSLYIFNYMDETHNLSKMRRSSQVCAILNLFSFGLSFVLAITGTAFQYVDGHYQTGALYDMVTVIPIVSLLYLTGYIIFHVKEIGAHDVIAATGYICFMLAGALIESAYSIGTTYVAVAIADLFIFVLLQNGVIAQEKQNVLEWMKKSNTDELTGFFNRHAYEDDMKALEDGEIEEHFVYVSVDVNSLKMVNDSTGHDAGDELLIGAAECLRQCLGPYGKLYRTGGDEFIGLLYVEDEKLAAIQKEMEELAEKWNGRLAHSLAMSCGYVAKKENPDMSVRKMAILADQRMYEAKDAYYRRTGIERRRK